MPGKLAQQRLSVRARSAFWSSPESDIF